MTYEDKTKECSDCRQAFAFTAGEQQFFAEKQFQEPKRCKPCREQRKAEKEERAVREAAPPPADLDQVRDFGRRWKGRRAGDE